jgi:glutamate-1-semialdehyde 2,1-aminomutase
MDAAQKTFMSSTYWSERIGPAAALATIRKHRRDEVAKHLVAVGQRVQDGWKQASSRQGLAIEVGGIPPLSHFVIQGDRSQEAHTLFTQMMLERGILASKGFYSTYAHKDEHIETYLNAVDDVFGAIVKALDKGDIQELLKGPLVQSGFRRLA